MALTFDLDWKPWKPLVQSIVATRPLNVRSMHETPLEGRTWVDLAVLRFPVANVSLPAYLPFEVTDGREGPAAIAANALVQLRNGGS